MLAFYCYFSLSALRRLGDTNQFEEIVMVFSRNLAVIAAMVVGAGTVGVIARPVAAATQQQYDQWMAGEAVRVVNATYKPTSCVATRVVSGSSVSGSFVRVIGSSRKTYFWKVPFTVVGSGASRQLVAGSPQITGYQ
jgi:hypothetical protein